MDYNEICEFVLLERRRQKLNQKDLASLAEVSKGTIQNIEKKKSVYPETLVKVFRALGHNLNVYYKVDEPE